MGSGGRHSDGAGPPAPRRLPRRALVRAALLLAIVLAGCLVALLVDIPDVATLHGQVDSLGAPGWAALVAGLALATLAPLPRSALSMLSGVLAGFWAGLPLALGSGVLGALAGFGLARWLGRETVTRLAGPRLARIDALLTERGMLAVLAGRLIPVTPFTLVSYACGLSGMRWWPYLAGSALGLVPGTVLYVTIGATVGAAGSAGSPALLLTLVPVALAGGALLLIRLRRRSPRTLIEQTFEGRATVVPAGPPETDQPLQQSGRV